MTKYKNPSEVERVYSPALWTYAASNAELAYNAVCPTLWCYSSIYGEKVAERWLYMQIMALYGASSNHDKGIIDGIQLFAASFLSQVKAFKLSEMMLFFARYKAGRYDNSYYSFDTRRIGNAFFKEFLPERQIELDRINKQEEQRKIEERAFTPPKGHTSLSWYQELKRRAEQGDNEAKQQLSIF